MIKTWLKTLGRMFKKHITRFLSLVFMVLIAVAFISGIGSSTDKINKSLTKYYKQQNVGDFIIRSMSPQGFGDEDISAVKELFPQADVDVCTAMDVKIDETRSVRLYFVDFENWNVNVPNMVEGEMPSDKTQAVAERGDNVIKGCSVGEEADLSSYGLPFKVTVSGTVQSPLTFALDGEPSDYNDIDKVPDSTVGTKDMNCLENILYISSGLAGGYLPLNYISVAVDDRGLFNALSDGYKSFTDKQTVQINDNLQNVKVLTLFDNYSFVSLTSYAEKVEGIGYILMVAFLLVTILVVLSTMTRLIEEERPQIACLKTLGYSSGAIISKYVLFAFLATAIGGLGAYFAGLGLTELIYFVFNYSFAMPPVTTQITVIFFVITSSVIIAATLLATVFSGLKMANERPANLLRPKPPRAGKKVFLEKIPLIWNKLSFKYKSTLRNVFRYFSRFIMTVVAVAFSTALVLTGLALLDMCLFGDFGSASIMGIAAVIVVFAGLLTAVVIYTLTNINISERNKEIATLMVLGYQDREVTGYIYREVYINTVIGIIFGYPLAVFLIYLVFSAMGFGTLAGISWFMWLIAPFIVLLFTGLVTLTLRRKIVKINMNESLKANE